MTPDQEVQYNSFLRTYGREVAERYRRIAEGKPSPVEKPPLNLDNKMERIKAWNVPFDCAVRCTERDKFDAISYNLAIAAIALIETGYRFSLKDVAQPFRYPESHWVHRPILREWIKSHAEKLPTFREAVIKEVCDRLLEEGRRISPQEVSRETGISAKIISGTRTLREIIKDAKTHQQQQQKTA